MLRKLYTYIIALVLLSVGVGSLIYMIAAKPQPQGEAKPYPGPLVRVFRVEEQPHQITVSAYGTCRAAKEWTAIAEVSGRIADMNAQFAEGRVILPDTVLARIDPTDYELTQRRYEAEVRLKEAQIRELEQKGKNYQALLALRDRQLKIAARDLERQKELALKGAATPKETETAEDAHVSQMANVTDARNALNLIPIQRDQFRADLDLAKIRVAEAKRQISKTEIKIAFAARCSSKSVEPDQYVAAGQELGKFVSLDKAAVVAVVEPRLIATLFPRGMGGPGPIDIAKITSAKLPFSLPAEIEPVAVPVQVTWQGNVVRVEASLDQATRTLNFVVEVPEPYRGAQVGARPPLLPGMFCRVRLFGATLPKAIVIPRTCLRGDRVFLFREGKLHIKTVDVLSLEEDIAIVADGLCAGDTVVMSDVFPAVEGMPLRAKAVPSPARARPPTTATTQPTKAQ